MLWKLLRRNISVWQLAGYAFSTFVGLLIVLVALQLYRDMQAGLRGEELIARRNIVISKPVKLQSTLSGAKPLFSESEIAVIAAQPWARGVMPFRAADFKVWAQIDMGGRQLSTALFFESVPDSIVDVDPAKWTFDPDSPSIPILISKDYLSLYNFGFAAGSGMPMLTEGMISSLPLTVTIAGQGGSATLPARIVGFSSWLNTVAVPQKFMDWAHSRYGDNAAEASAPTRLVIAVDDAAAPGVEDFIKSHGYDQAGNTTELGRASFMLTVLTAAIAGIGALITALALGILVLSLYLLVQKNRKSISTLLMLGYTPRTVASRYFGMVACINAGVLAAACVALVAVKTLWDDALATLGFEQAPVLATVAVGAALMAGVCLLNFVVIRRLVTGCFR